MLGAPSAATGGGGTTVSSDHPGSCPDRPQELTRQFLSGVAPRAPGARTRRARYPRVALVAGSVQSSSATLCDRAMICAASSDCYSGAATLAAATAPGTRCAREAAGARSPSRRACPGLCCGLDAFFIAFTGRPVPALALLPLGRAALLGPGPAQPTRRLRVAHFSIQLYEQFRPAIPEGEAGWGAKGVLDLAKIESLVA